MTEAAFLNAIDCRFPYADERQWRALIAEGHAISANAAFGVLEEIARKPAGNLVRPEEQLAMVAAWAEGATHPLTPLVLEAATAIITDELHSVERVLALFAQIRAYPHQYCALNIASFACDDVNGHADAAYEEIIAAWR